MAATNTASHAGALAERLLTNDYAQENLANAVESLRAAYSRASKRRVEPTRDEKLRRQIQQAARSLAEGAQALRTGRTKPKPRRGRRVILVIGFGVLGLAAVLGASEELRSKLFGGGTSDAQSDIDSREATSPK